MNAAIPVEEAYKILTDEKQNGHIVLAKAAFDKVIHSHLFREFRTKRGLLLKACTTIHFHILRVFHQVKQWIGEVDKMEAKDWGWSLEHNISVPIRSSCHPLQMNFLKRYIADVRQNAIQKSEIEYNN
jgi:hypothetical protein